MAAIFGERNIFLKIGKSIFFGYPVGRKFQQNRYILQEDESKLVFLDFWQEVENSKWPPVLGRGIFF